MLLLMLRLDDYVAYDCDGRVVPAFQTSNVFGVQRSDPYSFGNRYPLTRLMDAMLASKQMQEIKPVIVPAL